VYALAFAYGLTALVVPPLAVLVTRQSTNDRQRHLFERFIDLFGGKRDSAAESVSEINAE